MIGKVLPWLTFVLFAALLILVYAMRDGINNYVSELMQQQASPEIKASGEAYIDSLYSYPNPGFT